MLAQSTSPTRLELARGALEAICRQVDELEVRLCRAHDGPDSERQEQTRQAFDALVREANEWLSPSGPLSAAERSRIGEQLGRRMLPWLLLSENAERWRSKPRGYAGDFFSIEQIYRDEARGVGPIGALLDRCFLDLSAAQAVRNRRPLMAREIAAAMKAAGERPARITSLACGPARELFDALDSGLPSDKLEATLLDIDFRALAFVAEERDRRGLRRSLRLENGNLIHLARGRSTLSMAPQDLIYSVGLIDYFADDLVVELLDWIFEQLRPGGRVILGNFHPRNPSRAFMDHVLDWKLVHRSEAQMHGLFERSRFGRRATRIVYEEERINLFAECHRA